MKMQTLTKEARLKKQTYEREYHRKPELILKARKDYIKHRYGLTVQEYEAIAKSQNYRCAICNIEMVLYNKSLTNRACLDHNHITNKIRGMLCDRCNRGIALLDSDKGITSLQKAIDYITQFDGV